MVHRSRLSLAATAALFVATALGACGTTDVSGTDGGKKSDAAAISDSCAADNTKTSTDPVTITDDFGRKVSLDKPAQRVVSLEWQPTENLLSLCVAPVAVADAEGYSTWVTAEKLPKNTKDVGKRSEPNLDAVYAANPDLIIVEVSNKDDAIITQLEKRGVPFIATTGADGKDPLGYMKKQFSMVGDATGRSERADAVLAEFDAHVGEAKKKIASANLSSKEFVYFDGWVEGGTVALRPFGEGSLVSALGEEIGLESAWRGKVDPLYGLGQTDIEGMSAVGKTNLLYTSTKDPSGDYVAEMKKNSIWTSLPAVKEGKAKPFPEGVWTFGGPRSSEQVLDAYVETLTAS